MNSLKRTILKMQCAMMENLYFKGRYETKNIGTGVHFLPSSDNLAKARLFYAVIEAKEYIRNAIYYSSILERL